ncbi:Uu.00g042030.m01.CDS01 [Anthostomella pinea]|uniref:Uu.00g042030.m01.CDS01 n=1 Tax=Anthostomella pinea TaxID=933095 RepID=A0AAI8VAI1_9PEZI|nr:Uu.00g042030.m01.CDS01 [Anthostomella pinea]
MFDFYDSGDDGGDDGGGDGGDEGGGDGDGDGDGGAYGAYGEGGVDGLDDQSHDDDANEADSTIFVHDTDSRLHEIDILIPELRKHKPPSDEDGSHDDASDEPLNAIRLDPTEDGEWRSFYDPSGSATGENTGAISDREPDVSAMALPCEVTDRSPANVLVDIGIQFKPLELNNALSLLYGQLRDPRAMTVACVIASGADFISSPQGADRCNSAALRFGCLRQGRLTSRVILSKTVASIVRFV